MRALLLLALLRAGCAADASVPLRLECSAESEQIASVSASDRVQVGMALAGEAQTCYKLTLLRDSGNITGYVLSDSLPATAAFVREREQASKAAAREDARLARQQLAKQQAKNDNRWAPPDPLVSSEFRDFTARDMGGKLVSLSGLNGRVTLVTFWSPADHRSIGQLTSVMPLYNQFHSKGLAAVGISTDPRAQRIFEALDDVTLPFAQVADRSGLTARYQVDPNVGKTFVLDASRRIVAAGPMGPEIVKVVHQLLSVPENQ